MSYAIYIGKNHSATGHAWLAGYGDEPSSHWLEIHPRKQHPAGAQVTVGVEETADLPGRLTQIPQASETARNIRVDYSYYKGAPAPLTNGGLNEYGVAVRDVWSTSRDALIAMTPETQSGPNYSDLARMVLERAKTARHGVEIIASLIAAYGDSTYGGNSHLIADADEAWVVIQFAGGQGLWAAERLGPDSIRISRPGYITTIPIGTPDHPDFLYSENLIHFAQKQGWYTGGHFDVNAVLGDGKGRWDGVKWIEAQMRTRANRPEKIGFHDMIWAIRTPTLTGDTAGYGQIVPLNRPSHDALRMLWHAPIGAIAAPFAPVFMGQHQIPEEFRMHRYLTAGEAHRFVDPRKAVSGDTDALSKVTPTTEAFRCAVAEGKRLLYLMLLDPERYLPDVTTCFEKREDTLAHLTHVMLAAACALLEKGDACAASRLLDYFSSVELLNGLDLVATLSSGIETRTRLVGRHDPQSGQRFPDQIW
ncbi:MAG: C69 family dipeptidase [Pseudoprimorskyibacter sp.]|nr:C69 family dipeptidase [Pseudoprimorskyibacter sp.]